MFADSCIQKLTARAALERATVPPRSILPCYIGTGNTVLSVDASGLQSLNNRQQYAYTLDLHNSTSGDMYILSHGRVGDQISPQNVLPYGYLDWLLEIDGRPPVRGCDLPDVGAKWERELHTDDGSVRTRFLVFSDLWLEFALWMPKGTDCLLMKIRTRSHYVIPNGAPEDAEGARRVRRAKLTVALCMESRRGVPFFDEANLVGDTLQVEVAGHEIYRYAVRVTTADGQLPAFAERALTLGLDVSARGDEERENVVLFDFGGTRSAAEAEQLLAENRNARDDYFDRVARISGLDERESFLYYHTHHLLTSGFDYRKGLPIGSPFFFPDCWRASTFWDSHFVMDGLMRCGARKEAEEFLRFLRRCLRPEGKPYSWMFLYDGTSTVADERDIAPLVIAAHAHTALNFDEYFDDPALREECVLPIVKRCCDFALQNLLARDGDGRYILSAAVSNDVVDEVPDEINQTFTLVWFLSVLKKYQRLRAKMGLLPDPDATAVLDSHRIENDGVEYCHSKGYTAADYRWASWIPFLCYPSEGMPLLDMAMADRTSKKYNFRDLYLEKQSCTQPWTDFIEANSDFRRGDVEKGYRFRRYGMEHAFGLGLFSEVGAKEWCVTVPPYVSAHGSYLTALLYQFVATDSWDNRIGLFTCAHADYDERTISVEGAVCCGNLRVSVTRSPDELRAVVEGEGEFSVAVDVRPPKRLPRELLRVRVDGVPVPVVTRPDGVLTLRVNGSRRALITLD